MASPAGAVMAAQGGTPGDPTTLAGVAAIATAAGAVLKTLFDARHDRGKARTESEELVRDDLMKELADQRLEIRQLRAELAEARKEIREMSAQHARDIANWQDRYSALLDEVSKLRNELGRGKEHRK